MKTTGVTRGGSAGGMVLLACLALFGTGAGVEAQTSWSGSRTEPRLFSVQGRLSNLEGLAVHIRTEGRDHWLKGHDALAFLSARDYLRFDRQRDRWVITDKYRQWQQSNTWEGTWSIMSHHQTGPLAGSGYPSSFTVTLRGSACHVVWGGKPVSCSVSQNQLVMDGRHDSGGRMRWTFVRDGKVLDPERSRFTGVINGLPASGTYSGEKSD